MDFKFIALADVTLRVAVEGQGPLVVLVHGFPESWFSWRHQLRPIAEAAGLAAAIDYLTEIGLDAVHAHEQRLLGQALGRLAEIDGVRILGPAEPTGRGSAVSFVVDGVHPHDVSQILDEQGIAVRAGHHCAWPLHRALGVQASTRASFYLYNTADEVEALAAGIVQAQRFFQSR